MKDKNTTQNMINEDDTVMFSERKRILFFGLPWTFTKYTITPNLLTIDQGLINTTENDCYMYKIQDVKLTTSLMERLVGVATITCFTGDVTHPELKLIHIRNAKEIKNYLLNASETARIKRRTLNTMDIGVQGLDADHDGILDDLE